jgi:recombination protein RecT
MASKKTTELHAVMAMLERGKPEIQKACPANITAEYLIRVTKTAILDNPEILRASPESICRAVTHAAQLGLSVDPHMAEGYLVPYGQECKYMTGYQGLIALALRSEKVESVFAQVVYANDKFTFRWGNYPTIEHEPAAGDRGAPLGAWALAFLKGADKPLMDYMSKPDILKIKGRSKAANNGPWKTDEMEMWRKTVVRRLSKYLPKSRELASAFSHEVELDDIVAATEQRPAVRQPQRVVEEQVMADGSTREVETEAETEAGGQWRLHFTAADQPKIEAWLKGEHKLTGDDLIDVFFRDTWQDDPSDALDAAVHWLGKQPSQGNLGV